MSAPRSTPRRGRRRRPLLLVAAAVVAAAVIVLLFTVVFPWFDATFVNDPVMGGAVDR